MTGDRCRRVQRPRARAGVRRALVARTPLTGEHPRRRPRCGRAVVHLDAAPSRHRCAPPPAP